MQLVQLFLPLEDNERQRFPREAFLRVHRELTARFGGVTAYLHAPAEGAWKEGGEVVRDRVVMFEVMTRSLERDFWAHYRKTLEDRFQQTSVVVRALGVELL